MCVAKMSSLDDLESPWGQLVSMDNSGDDDAETVPIVGDKFTIGRGKGERNFNPRNLLQKGCEVF